MGLKIWRKHLIGNWTQPNCYSPCKLLPSFHKLLFFIALLITRHLNNLPSWFMPPCLTWISMNLFHFYHWVATIQATSKNAQWFSFYCVTKGILHAQHEECHFYQSLPGPLECSSYFNVQSLRVVFKVCIRFLFFHYNSRSKNLPLIWFDKLAPNMSCMHMKTIKKFVSTIYLLNRFFRSYLK
jgi:hypothetical protein